MRIFPNGRLRAAVLTDNILHAVFTHARRQAIPRNDRDRLKPETLRSRKAPVAGEDHSGFIAEDWRREAPFADARGELSDLRVVVFFGITREWGQAGGRDALDRIGGPLRGLCRRWFGHRFCLWLFALRSVALINQDLW